MSDTTSQHTNDDNETSLQIIQAAVQEATEKAYVDWAAAHPSLAGVIDRAVLKERTAESIRKSSEFKEALSGFYESKNELDLLRQFMELAGPLLRTALGL